MDCIVISRNLLRLQSVIWNNIKRRAGNISGSLILTYINLVALKHLANF